MTKARHFVLAPVLASVLAVPAAPAGAQGIEAAPLRVEIQAPPGGTHTQAITVRNPGREQVRVRATLTDWHLSRDGTPQFEDPDPGRAYTASSWLRFAPHEFTLDPGKEGTVRYTVLVPADTQPGGYRTGLLLEFVPDPRAAQQAGRQIVVRSRIASLIYVTVGQPVAAVELTDFSVRHAADATTIVAALKNGSRFTARTRGTLQVYDKVGIAVVNLIVPDVPVLPESERELAIAATDALKTLVAGEYRVEIKLDLGMPALLVGETTLRVAR